MTAALPLERVLVIAPHPDDETIAAGGLIQRIEGAGGRLQVVYVTDGDNNLWPQRLSARKWRISTEERAKWGMMRREESRHALSELGAPADNGIFLGYPDYKLAALARRGDRRITDALRALIEAFNPTLVVTPSILDLHSDHRALALFTHEAAPGRAIITYIVHGAGPAGRIAARLELTQNEQAHKRAAIERHASQLWLSRERFLSYARHLEVFFRDEHDILRPDTLWWTWRCKMLHGLRVVLRKGSEVS